MIFLAAPYRDEDPKVRADRVQLTKNFAAYLVSLGYPTYAPIVYGHSIQDRLNHLMAGGEHLSKLEPKDYEPLWRRTALRILPVCDFLLVLLLDGWLESEGVKDERRLATLLYKDVRYTQSEIPNHILEETLDGSYAYCQRERTPTPGMAGLPFEDLT